MTTGVVLAFSQMMRASASAREPQSLDTQPGRDSNFLFPFSGTVAFPEFHHFFIRPQTPIISKGTEKWSGDVFL